MSDIASDLELALLAAGEHLSALGVPHMLIGGLALAAWGFGRSTLDVDITVWAAPEEIGALIDQLTARLISRSSAPHEFVAKTRVLPLQTERGVRIDILFAAFPFERQMTARAVVRQVGSTSARVASLEDLLLTKIISTRPKDLADVETILSSSARELDWGYLEPLAVELAEAVENPEILDRLRRHRP